MIEAGRYPAVAWAEAARMRDRLVHHYFDINLDILWSTVREDLPALLEGLQEANRELGDLERREVAVGRFTYVRRPPIPLP